MNSEQKKVFQLQFENVNKYKQIVNEVSSIGSLQNLLAMKLKNFESEFNEFHSTFTEGSKTLDVISQNAPYLTSQLDRILATIPTKQDLREIGTRNEQFFDKSFKFLLY